jgi:hypothetical protein
MNNIANVSDNMSQITGNFNNRTGNMNNMVGNMGNMTGNMMGNMMGNMGNFGNMANFQQYVLINNQLLEISNNLKLIVDKFINKKQQIMNQNLQQEIQEE